MQKKQLITDLTINGVITTGTFNGILPSSNFLFILYLTIGFVSLLSICYWVYYKKYISIKSLKNSSLTGLLVAGIIYSIKADVIWFTWVLKDWNQLKGISEDKKLSKLTDQDFYEFIKEAKKVLKGEDYVLYTTHISYYMLASQYYLLPSQKKNTAPFVVILYAPSDIKYISKSKTLYHNNKKTENLKMHMFFDQDAYILRKI